MWAWLLVVILEEVSVKNHWQEPAVFSLALPLLSAAAKWKELKASKRSLKQERSSKQVKRRSRRTEIKSVCERIRQENSK